MFFPWLLPSPELFSTSSKVVDASAEDILLCSGEGRPAKASEPELSVPPEMSLPAPLPFSRLVVLPLVKLLVVLRLNALGLLILTVPLGTAEPSESLEPCFLAAAGNAVSVLADGADEEIRKSLAV